MRSFGPLFLFTLPLLLTLVLNPKPFTFAAVIATGLAIASRADPVDSPIYVCPNYRNPQHKAHAVATLLQTPQLERKKCSTKVKLMCVGLYTVCSVECTNAVWEVLYVPFPASVEEKSDSF